LARGTKLCGGSVYGTSAGGRKDGREVPGSVLSGQQHGYDEVEAMASRFGTLGAAI
jgi:hypothetical protein